MSVLGIDLGTTGVRAVAFSADGRVLDAASEPLSLYRDTPGRAELDPTEVLRATERVVAQASAEATARQDPPQALAFAVLGEAVLPVDAAGNALARIALSMDTRGNHAAELLDESIGAARFTEITGQPLHGMFSVFKIAAGGQGWEEAAGYRCVGDFITEQWTGQAAIDYSQAARTGLFDVETLQWSDELIAAVQIAAPWITRDKLPEPVAGGNITGYISSLAAERLGLVEGIPLVAAAHDQAAAYLGAGGVPEVNSVISFGSSDCVTVGTDTRPSELNGTGFATYPVSDGLWVTLAGTAAGGWALEWFAALVGGTVDDVFSRLARNAPPLLVLPYLAGSGTLDNDANARGTIHGLTLETTIPELARAVVEGAGLEFAKIIDALHERDIRVGTIAVTGSGSRNPEALNARANAAGHALTPVTKDAAARGAAVLAARGATLHAPGLTDAPMPVAATQEPDPTTSEWYDAQRERYRALFEATRAITFAPLEVARPNPAHEKENTK